jgi:integrase/recombinase XerD
MVDLNELYNQMTADQRRAFDALLKITNGGSTGLQVAQLKKPADGIEAWVNHLKVRGFSPRTISVYQYIVRKYLAGDPKPTTQTIEAHLARRLDVDKVSETAVSSEQKALKSLFTFLCEAQLWDSNPLAKMKLIKPETKERVCPTDEQVSELLYGNYRLHSKLGTLKFRTMVILLCDTALRISEAASILRKNISLHEPMQIKVQGKGKKERIVPIGADTAAHIWKWMELTKDTNSPYLFFGIDPRRYWDVTSIQENFHRICGKLGIDPITPHQLRHWTATRMLQSGAKLEIVSRLLGHSSVGITGDVYRHVAQDEIQSEHQKFSPMDRIAGARGS